MLNTLNPMKEDLDKSGLVPEDLLARALESTERAATNVPHSVQGYVIPYWDISGKPLPMYRVRLFDFIPKYKMPKDSSNFVYFPPNFSEVAKTKNYVLITEGEKKAALATKLGFPCCALGGVDSWRNRTVVLPLDSELTQNQSKGIIKAKVPSGSEISEEGNQTLATGMQELIDYLLMNKKQVIICFDSDKDVGVKPSVQRAAAVLGFEFRFRGVAFKDIRQLVLPPLDKTKTAEQNADVKVALDDYLVTHGKETFQELVDVCQKKRSAFPRHPSIRDFINRKMQRTSMSRKDIQALSIAILSDLDSNGMRLRSKGDDQTYYFDFVSRKLFRTAFEQRPENVSGTPFGQFLYRRYGLGGADQRLIIWLSTQFAGEDPIEEASPFNTIARVNTNDDSVNFKVSDSQYVRVNADGIELFDNGENGVLFEAGGTLPLDTERLLASFSSQNVSGTRLPNRWADVLSHVRLRDQEKQRHITALLYYMSPWLYRWRGMQLPVEMVIGESGSGKSTLCELRLTVLNGEAHLRNAPTDLKDWHASIANTGGLHVTDNVVLVERSLRQRLSDEICRIITEPEPHIEMRKYYTNAELMRIPVRSVFALTAIQQPFQNADLLQRAIILELDKTAGSDDGRPVITFDSEWKANQLNKFGGREDWVAHQLVVLHKFFLLVKAKWDNKYKAKHRLINFEQAMKLMGEVFGEEVNWIPDYLSASVDRTLEESDWTFEGLRAYVDTMGRHLHLSKATVSCQDISEWAQGEEEFKSCDMLTNPRRLARYMMTHKSIIAVSCCLVEAGKRNNRTVYKVLAPMKKS